ncbi:MAG: NAD(P)-dependent oxidoreductase [Verrucomicrobiota bacterium]
MKDTKVSVLGLGIIGSVWTKHYDDAGVLAASWNRSPKPESPLWEKDPADAAAKGDVIHLCVFDPPSVRETLERINPTLGPEKTVVQSTTIDPESAEKFASMVSETGASYVEAPFTGSKPAAEAKKTVFFLGGGPTVVSRVDPTLALLSRKCFVFESPRQAATIKLAMNHQISAITEALCEGISWARSAGLSDDQFFDVLRENVAWSGVAGLKEDKIKNMDFSPQFSLRNMQKDLRLAEECSPFHLPSLSLVKERLTEALEAGMGDDDFVSLLRLLP